MSKPWEERWRRYDLVLKAASIPAKLHAPHRAWVESFLKDLRPRKWWAVSREDIPSFLQALEKKAQPRWQLEQAEAALRFFFQETEPAPWAADWPIAKLGEGVETEALYARSNPPRRLDGALPHPALAGMKQALAEARLSPFTCRAYLGWVRRFLASHPEGNTPSSPQAAAFLAGLVEKRSLAPSTLTQAANALRFFSSAVLHQDLDLPRPAARTRRSPRALPPAQIASLLMALPEGPNRLLGQLLYEVGLSLSEAARLRVRHLALSRAMVEVEGSNPRTLPLPENLKGELITHLDRVQKLWENDRKGDADLSDGSRAWRDCWVFPSERALVLDGRIQRGPIHPQSFQQLLSRAAKRAGLVATPHTLRYSFAQRRLEEGMDLATLRQRLGHADLASTSRYRRFLLSPAITALGGWKASASQSPD